MDKPSQIDNLEKQTIMLRERNSEYLVIVKNADGELCWKSSDKTWAMGAVERYMEFNKEVERCDARTSVIREDE